MESETKEVACSLAKTLSVNKGLKTLHLNSTQLGEVAIQHLVGSLLYNFTLKEI